MIFTMEASKPIENPTAKDIEKALRKLKLTGRHEYANLEDAKGNYIQAAGGGVACMLEMRQVEPLRHFRGYQDKKHLVFPDGTKLRFAGSEIPLNSNEWMTIGQVVEAFLAFHAGTPLPDWLKWRDISSILVPQ